MRSLLLGILAVILLLLGVIAVRTLMVPAPVETTSTQPPASSFDAQAIATRLSQAVKLRTISWQDGAKPEDIAASQLAFVAMREWIATTYPQISKAASQEIINDYSLLYTWKGSDPSLKPILLMSHMDVVPIAPGSDKDWTHEPFSGDIADGYIWGRGTMDTKAGIIGILEAAEALAAKNYQPKRTIMFSFGHDEEKGGHQGNKKISSLLAERQTKLEFVIDEGGLIATGVIPGITVPVAMIGVAEKGSVTLELTSHSEGGHSSLPLPVPETAIGRLARAIGRVGDAPFESHIDGIARDQLTQLMPNMPLAQRVPIANLWLFEPLVVSSMNAKPGSGASLHTTIAPTIISGGNKENVLPPDATALINFRVHPRDTIESLTQHVKEAIDDDKVDVKVRPGGRNASPISDVTGPQFAFIKRALQKIAPNAIVAPNLLSAGTDSRYYQPMTDNVFRMVPMLLSADDLKGFHGTNERVPVKSMSLIADFFTSLMTEYDNEKAASPVAP